MPSSLATRGGVLALTLALAAPALAQSQPASTRLRGSLVSADRDAIVVQTAGSAPVTVHLGQNIAVGRRVKADLSTIHPQDYVGVTAVPAPHASLKAVEVFIFPPNMRGVGEGHRPYDLLPESTMTNATIAETVDTVDGKAMKLTYKGGEKSIVLTPESRVYTFATGGPEDLKPGRQVSLSVQQGADGPTTSRITVDEP